MHMPQPKLNRSRHQQWVNAIQIEYNPREHLLGLGHITCAGQGSNEGIHLASIIWKPVKEDLPDRRKPSVI
jgi:hypothetical protein